VKQSLRSCSCQDWLVMKGEAVASLLFDSVQRRPVLSSFLATLSHLFTSLPALFSQTIELGSLFSCQYTQRLFAHTAHCGHHFLPQCFRSLLVLGRKGSCQSLLAKLEQLFAMTLRCREVLLSDRLCLLSLVFSQI
jgi:hypothetical protein